MNRLKLLLALLTAAAVWSRGATRSAAMMTAAPAVTDAAQFGPDFAVQGEYIGKAGDGVRGVGAQVIALGGGSFQAVFLPGGLPGAGWDARTRVRVAGKTDGKLTVFGAEGTGWWGRLGDGKLVGRTETGSRFELRKVTRDSPTLGAKPPQDAVVLFNGRNTDAWMGGGITADGLLQPGGRTKQSFRDFSLHVEFRTPFKPESRGQARGNSGVYLLGHYEVQILDSFGLDGKENECGALYRQKAPAVNMCYPPLSWQTFDIDFTAPRFDPAGQKTRNAVISVRHNGVAVHDHFELTGATGGGRRTPETASGAISLQNHGNPVFFRNLWLVERS